MQSNQVQGRKFFDRQMQLFGERGQAAISSSWVALINFTPAHAELAKNLALLGFSLLLVDAKPLTADDIRSNLFFNAPQQAFEGRPRIDVALDLLRDLNPFIQIIVARSLEEIQNELVRCRLFLSCPTNFAELEYLRNTLDTFNGIKIYSFCDFGTGLSFLERRTDEKTSSVSLLDKKDYSGSFNRLPLIHKFCTQYHSRQEFDYNRNGDDWFAFSGVYGSLLSQLVLNCVLEGELDFNTISYDVFGSEEHPLDACFLQTLRL